jgi:hypothetical protein
MKMFAMTLALAILSMGNLARAYDADNIKALLKKNKNCVFAVYRVMRGKSTRDSFPQRFDISCIGDVKVGEGTIHEKHGCAAFNYNVETGKMMNLTNFGINIAENKACADGGFDALLGDLLYNDNSGAKPRKVLVRDFFAPMPESNEPASFFRLVVYSENDSYRTKLGYPKEDVDLKTLDVSKTPKKEKSK